MPEIQAFGRWAGLLTLSCVDKAYDLGRLEGGQIAVGDDESEFAAPLVTVTVLLDDIHDSQGSLQEMLDEADIWLPSELPGGVDYVDFQRLYADDAYLAEVTGALVDPRAMSQVPCLHEHLANAARVKYPSVLLRDKLDVPSAC